jgi:hypothetical protein
VTVAAKTHLIEANLLVAFPGHLVEVVVVVAVVVDPAEE